MTDQKDVSFKDTLNLPHTEFPIRSNPAIDDPEIIKSWHTQELYGKAFELNKGKVSFVLHDGPPYANGHLHLGSSYNKILKDIVAKSKRMAGLHVPFTPGWDCHGLPIEFKVSQENPGLSGGELKKACRDYAAQWVDIQKEEFKRLGLLMNFDDPYLTMSPSYEASILETLSYFVSHGFIERKNKTVPWCMSCKTVLATAEIEYEDRKDPSLFITFRLEQTVVNSFFPQLANSTVSFLIWTTTPWTLPLNRAVLLRPGQIYAVVACEGQYLIMAMSLVEKVALLTQKAFTLVEQFLSDSLLLHCPRAFHPFIDDFSVPVLADLSVEVSEGTACVHNAPGAGPIDYEIGVRNGLEIFSPVESDGTYNTLVKPQELVGMSISDGQIWVIKKLAECKALFYKTTVRHSYPHCWRCHNGLIFRATKQWFFDLSKEHVKERALEQIKQLSMYPEASRNRLLATIEGRLEWCISRQRVWGVPIPALICNKCDFTHINENLINTVAKQVLKRGIEYWDEVDVTALVTPDFLCSSCNGNSWRKEMDILDVWFDSGVSHYAVLKKRSDLSYPADLYLEGKDQHRGWFQSSLLTSIALGGQACTRAILTHGFTVDKMGRKMSKSLGNVVLPQSIIDQLGTDGLRLWVASIDYADDAIVSDVLLRNVQEVLRKVRNTCRFLLSNLYDFDQIRDAIAYDDMRSIDQYALIKLSLFDTLIRSFYEEYNFTGIFHALAEYCSVDLSSFYLDIVKDRLYVEKADGPLRRSAQTACFHILDTVTKLIAPLLSFTAESITDHYQKNKAQSVHLQPFADLSDMRAFFNKKGGQGEDNSDFTRSSFVITQCKSWDLILLIREAILKAIEQKRITGIIKHPLEVRLSFFAAFDSDRQALFDSFFELLARSGQSTENFFKELVIVSQVAISQQKEGLNETILPGFYVLIDQAKGAKCPRCWQWEISHDSDALCERCRAIIR